MHSFQLSGSLFPIILITKLKLSQMVQADQIEHFCKSSSNRFPNYSSHSLLDSVMYFGFFLYLVSSTIYVNLRYHESDWSCPLAKYVLKDSSWHISFKCQNYLCHFFTCLLWLLFAVLTVHCVYCSLCLWLTVTVIHCAYYTLWLLFAETTVHRDYCSLTTHCDYYSLLLLLTMTTD